MKRVQNIQPKSYISAFVPKIFTVLKEGYYFKDFKNDFLAGLTVSIVALPLSMALAIASGTTPDKGLVTAVVAGFLISFLGGSRYQIGGPTGAFVVIVFHVIEKHGFDGLILATFLAGFWLILFGLARFGSIIKYIPSPVITGFTAGIAVIIFSSQVKDLLGLSISKVPGDFIDKWEIYFRKLDTVHIAAIGLSLTSLASLILLRHFLPRWPNFLIVVGLGALTVWGFNLPVATIGTEFGTIPDTLPQPLFPDVTLAKIISILPSSFTIAFLAAIESLLSAVIADGMTGARHKSDCELVAQGVANIGSAFFAGLPATGAIARTATNIRSGAKGPVAGMLHALFLLLFMLLVAPYAQWLPLASLAAILVIVAWNMSEIERFKYLLKAPKSDSLVLVLTFLLTIFVDLTIAISVGIVLSSLLFMRRMSEVTHIQKLFLEENAKEEKDEILKHFGPSLPKGVEIYKITGPFFFGAAALMQEIFDQIQQAPSVLILRMREVPFMDATGITSFEQLLNHAKSNDIKVILTGVQKNVLRLFERMHLKEGINYYAQVENYDEAIELVKKIL